ncbi:MAG TPA: hypothetical protein VGF34_19325 [Stellaceae bacterium]
MTRLAGRSHLPQLALALSLAASPFGCAVPPAPPANPFVGTWATADNDIVTIRADTIVQREPDGRSVTLDNRACGGVFRFNYDTRSRQTLTGLIMRQPELQKKLSELLPAPIYRVVELVCDHGDQTYVLLNDRQLVAIYRDGDIGAIDRLARR